MSISDLKFFFNVSKFTVLNEITDTKASLLSYVEFLEGVARCAEKLSFHFDIQMEYSNKEQ